MFSNYIYNYPILSTVFILGWWQKFCWGGSVGKPHPETTFFRHVCLAFLQPEIHQSQSRRRIPWKRSICFALDLPKSPGKKNVKNPKSHGWSTWKLKKSPWTTPFLGGQLRDVQSRSWTCRLAKAVRACCKPGRQCAGGPPGVPMSGTSKTNSPHTSGHMEFLELPTMTLVQKMLFKPKTILSKTIWHIGYISTSFWHLIWSKRLENQAELLAVSRLGGRGWSWHPSASYSAGPTARSSPRWFWLHGCSPSRSHAWRLFQG